MTESMFSVGSDKPSLSINSFSSIDVSGLLPGPHAPLEVETNLIHCPLPASFCHLSFFDLFPWETYEVPQASYQSRVIYQSSAIILHQISYLRYWGEAQLFLVVFTPCSFPKALSEVLDPYWQLKIVSLRRLSSTTSLFCINEPGVSANWSQTLNIMVSPFPMCFSTFVPEQSSPVT